MLTKNEIERYSRQILFVGRENQIKFKSTRVLVLGAGGIGATLLPYLASSGIGFIRVIDPDVIERSNLSRQNLFQEENIGALKGPTAVSYLEKLNPYIEIEWIPGKFNTESHIDFIKDIDLIIDGTDDILCKFFVSDLSVKKRIPVIIGSIGNVQGHVFTHDSRDSACYRCLFDEPENPEDIPNCQTEGILSPLPGIIGSMMAYQVLNFIKNGSFLKKLYLMEETGWRTIPFLKNPQCSFCFDL